MVGSEVEVADLLVTKAVRRFDVVKPHCRWPSHSPTCSDSISAECIQAVLDFPQPICSIGHYLSTWGPDRVFGRTRVIGHRIEKIKPQIAPRSPQNAISHSSSELSFHQVPTTYTISTRIYFSPRLKERKVDRNE